MGESLAKLIDAIDRKKPHLNAEERNAILKTRKEVRMNRATVGNLLGGLLPSLCLGVFRRDNWTCKRCGGKENLGVHHKGGIRASPWLAAKGKRNDFNNIVTLCKSCHNTIHEEAKAQGL